MIKRLKKFLGLHIHEWTKWEVIESGKCGMTPEVTWGSYLIQTRHCTACGKHELNRTTT